MDIIICHLFVCFNYNLFSSIEFRKLQSKSLPSPNLRDNMKPESFSARGPNRGRNNSATMKFG